METDRKVGWKKRKEEILKALFSAGVKFVSRHILRRNSGKPAAEDIVGETCGDKATARWYDLPWRNNTVVVCPPTAVGCQVARWGRAREWSGGCLFCAVGRGLYERPLTADEIVGFVSLALDRSSHSRRFWRREQHLVIFMASAGEPLLNYGAVLRAVRRVKAAFGSNVHVALSTAGVKKGIDRLRKEDSDLGIQLRISVHFSTDLQRQKYMPMHDNLNEVIRAGIRYAKTTGIPIVVNWALIRGVNDEEEHLRELVRLVRGNEQHLIVRVARLNPYSGGHDKLQAPSKWRQRRFVSGLKKAGLRVVSVWRGYAPLTCEPKHFVSQTS